MHHYEIAHRNLLSLNEIQANLALYAFCRAKGVKAIDFDYLHWNAEAHEIILDLISYKFNHGLSCFSILHGKGGGLTLSHASRHRIPKAVGEAVSPQWHRRWRSRKSVSSSSRERQIIGLRWLPGNLKELASMQEER